MMVITNLFPEGILQIWDVLENGYWHARSLEFIGTDRIRMLEWVSMPSTSKGFVERVGWRALRAPAKCRRDAWA